ncbi:hypothetical protein BCR33DRAFT_419528 [Rhizoclosmatium globosum]|uniref:Uncharacterized protein n=1 Tax=Rhizoclosmatium globosum TaxID=329046 RepID=A0A1Y2BWQ5_9FUNG|nr:hypothetical protein BCR33DRAFT_419528 [Rhizoclosmatium globosum]|eukprot:ORY39200.1 hypothetical protein BCR33DRAFT_419528 [Rhizoclosmatium globosum]
MYLIGIENSTHIHELEWGFAILDSPRWKKTTTLEPVLTQVMSEYPHSVMKGLIGCSQSGFRPSTYENALEIFHKQVVPTPAFSLEVFILKLTEFCRNSFLSVYTLSVGMG